jgi:8-oxo-dGTP diphosphatase
MSNTLNPNISTDCVVFAFGQECLKVLLVEREFRMPKELNGVIHDMKLPGGLVYNDELLKDAAARILKELTGLDGVRLEQFDVLDSLQRMGNQIDKLWLEQTSGLIIDRVISIAFYGLVKLDDPGISELKEGCHWVEIAHTQKLPFDHNEIISRALETIRTKLRKDGIIFSLLPEKFTISQLQNIIKVFYEEEPDSRNFRKKIKKLDYIAPLAEKQINVAHKPAGLYRFDKKRFQQFNNSRISF